MKSVKRLIPLLLIAMYGIAYASYFLILFTSSILISYNPFWDPLSFIPGLADVDNLYLIFGTYIWLLFILLCSAGIAGVFMLLNRALEGPRTFRLEAKPRELSFSRLIRRAIIPAMFSFSIGEIAVQYLKQYATGIFVSPGLGSIPITDRLSLFVAKTFHLSFLFLPLTLAIIIPTWILNDSMVISHRKNTHSGNYSEPQKVGKWVSGLLSGFSVFAFPLAFLNAFLITPLENQTLDVVVEILPLILLIMANVMIVLVAYILPIIILYELGKTRIAGAFLSIAKKMGVDNSDISDSDPKPMIMIEDTSEI